MTSIKIISIDVGLRTLSISKECYSSLEPLNIQSSKRYNSLGESTELFKTSIDKVSKKGEVLFLEKIDLGDKKDYFAGRAFDTLYNWLDNISQDIQFSDTDVILIEQQLKTNYIATCIMHHIYCWLNLYYKNNKLNSTNIILYPSKNKTRILGMPLKVESESSSKLIRVTKYQRKKWSIEQMKRWITLRNDSWALDYIFKENKDKKDDLCDTLLQSFSYIVSNCL